MMRQRHFSAVATLLYWFKTLDPKLATVAAMAMEMPDAISAYSIAVVPLWSRQKRWQSWRIAAVDDVNMAVVLWRLFSGGCFFGGCSFGSRSLGGRSLGALS
jgi:hypothetical protein